MSRIMNITNSSFNSRLLACIVLITAVIHFSVFVQMMVHIVKICSFLSYCHLCSFSGHHSGSS